MSEFNQAVLVEGDIDPLQIVLAHGKKWKVGTGFQQLRTCHPWNVEQALAGLKCHDSFLFNNGFCCWVYTVIEQHVSDTTAPITQNSLFDANVIVKVKKGDHWIRGRKTYKDAGVVDVIECMAPDGTRTCVAVLCLLIQFKWHKVQYGNILTEKWFECPPDHIMTGLNIKYASEFNKNNMPFRYSDPGTDPNYTVATEYAIRKSAIANGFVRVNLVNGSSPGKSIKLFNDLYLRKGVNGKVYLRLTIMNKNLKWPLTTKTSFTMELQIRKGTKEQKWMAKPYHAEITAFYPWAVHMVSGCNLALMGFLLPIRDAYEARFFEEAFQDMASVEVKYVLTRQSLD